MKRFRDKAAAREAVWSALTRERAARFPFPVRGRIPNFAGAREAAARLLAHPAFAKVRVIKVNPDSAQRWVRQGALARGITVVTPTPRLKGAFRVLDPARIPKDRHAEAASIKRGGRWGRDVALSDLPRIDLVVMGSVAVTAKGARVGKGHGYADLEYGILRALGNPRVPVATSVHELQILGGFPTEAHDLPVSIIATPERIIEVIRPPRAPSGIDWKRLPPEALAEMPILEDLRRLLLSRGVQGSAARPKTSAPKRSSPRRGKEEAAAPRAGSRARTRPPSRR